MNEYLVGLIISKCGKISTPMIVEADNKDEAEKIAVHKCEENGISVYGWSYCDFIG